MELVNMRQLSIMTENNRLSWVQINPIATCSVRQPVHYILVWN